MRGWFRYGPVPIMQKLAIENRPEGMTKASARFWSTYATCMVGDMILTAQERMATAQQSWNPACKQEMRLQMIHNFSFCSF